MRNKIYTIPLDIRFRDLDALGHVNNAVYLTYLETIRVKWCQENSFVDLENPHKIPNILAHIEIDYKRPAMLKDQIVIEAWVSHIGNKSYTISYSINAPHNQIVYATAKSVQVWFDYDAQKPVQIPEKERKILETYLEQTS